MKNTYLEWVNSFHLALLYSNSRRVSEDSTTITCLSKDNNYKLLLRKHPSSDVLVYNHVFGDPKEYEIVCETYNKHFTNDQMFIIDAGANVGYATLYFANKYSNSKIVCIEPEQSNFKILNQNINANNLSKNVLPLHKALWYCNTTLELFTDNKKEWGFSVNEIQDSQSANKIETITVDDILVQQNQSLINILKIDIEGAEFEIFLDEKRCHGFLAKTQLAAIEIHDRNEKYEKIIANFASAGFSFFNSGELTIFINNNLVKK